MDPSRLLEPHRQMLSRLVRTLDAGEQERFMKTWDQDADVHNQWKQAALGTLRTPESSEYQTSKPLRKFIKKLAPVAVQRIPRYAGDDRFLYKPKHCLQNAHLFCKQNPKKNLELVFGFHVWMSDSGTFFRGEGHVWLRDLHDRKKWIDPTPPPDHEDTHVLNVESRDYLKPEERQLLQDLRDGGFAPPAKLPSIESTSTRLLAGCVTSDAIFHSSAFFPLHKLTDLHLLPPCEFPDFPTPGMARARQRLERKDEDFWTWRQSVVKKLR